MSNTLENIAATFGVSDPIFIAELRHTRDQIDFKVKNPYQPSADDYTDHIEHLVVGCYQERFIRQETKFVNETRCENVYRQIISEIRAVYEKYSGLKNPKQSKLYKWLYTMQDRYNDPLFEGFISLYRYMHKNSDGQGRFNNGPDNPHVKNILTILERMKDKHEDK